MLEIEHKFLIKSDNWKKTAGEGVLYRQGYIKTQSLTAVRVRIVGDKGFLTLKGRASGEKGISRSEFEYEIPFIEANEMMRTILISLLLSISMLSLSDAFAGGGVLEPIHEHNEMVGVNIPRSSLSKETKNQIKLDEETVCWYYFIAH